MISANPSSKNQKPELFFALVGAAGTRLNELLDKLRRELSSFGYQTVDIRLSGLLQDFTDMTDQKGTSYFDQITHKQKMGNAFRKQLNRGDALALAGIDEIRAIRARRENSKGPDDPAPAQAYILHQLKHPDEVDLLRQVYGASFLLIAAHTREKERIKELTRRSARKEGLRQGDESQASRIIRNDDKQDGERFGQNTRDTYPKADFFANLESPGWKGDVSRFVELIFGHPFHTPRPDEYAMYQANAVSLRSSDENRQVGAVICKHTYHHGNIRDTNIVAVGMNEVPRGWHGGYYCELDSPDVRDQADSEDRAFEIKISILTELIKKILQKDWIPAEIKTQDAHALAVNLLKDLKGTQFLDIAEFSRPVHAEMAALIDAARRGVAVNEHAMYVTTFPCHNCVKHIIAAGIRRVIYLEPYHKSRALDLYHEEITVELLYGDEQEGKVAFFPFTGVAPRQYPHLFSMSERGAKKGKSLTRWNAERANLIPLYVPQNASLLYLEAERQAVDALFSSKIYKRQS